MKHLLSTIAILFIINSFGQIDLKGFEKSEALSMQVKTSKGTIKFGDVEIYVHEEDYMLEDVVFGTWMKMVIRDIEERNVFEGFEFHLTRSEIINLDNGDTLLSSNWANHGADKQDLLKAGEENADISFKLNTGTPMTPGKYRWKIEMADMCSNKKTGVYLDFNLIQSPGIEVKTTGNTSIDLVYLDNVDGKYIYSNDTIFAEKTDLNFYGLSGFSKEDGISKIGMEVALIYASGDTIFFKEDEYEGVDAFFEYEQLKKVHSAIKFGSDVKGKNIIWAVRVWDKLNEENSLTVKAKLYVHK